MRQAITGNVNKKTSIFRPSVCFPDVVRPKSSEILEELLNQGIIPVGQKSSAAGEAYSIVVRTPDICTQKCVLSTPLHWRNILVTFVLTAIHFLFIIVVGARGGAI